MALPFVLNEEGVLVPGEAQDRQSASAAIRLAEDMARRFGGAVLRSFGEVPRLDDLFGG